MNFKEWHNLMKNQKYQNFQSNSIKNNSYKPGHQDDFNATYQKQYIRDHPKANQTYNRINEFLDELWKFGKRIYF
ncbi:hypothetical protein [Companilactobacillus zhongbaensis]|uniref:hypothetical protein n=1 Tax=Companilactobacillus zhongbaensis TaxID=2486009 RepID=UPI000F79935E|nr:hypothetical protein [Companilactobacillus zhongbaensis]